MSATRDILRTWIRPLAVFRDLASAGRREDRVLAYLLAGCLLVFIGRLPVLQRLAIEADGDFFRDTSYAFLALMMLAPILFYGIAAAGWAIARVFGSRPTGYGARLALFWAYLAAAPAGLLYGLTVGLTGPGPAVTLVGAIWLGALLIFWGAGLAVTGRETTHA